MSDAIETTLEIGLAGLAALLLVSFLRGGGAGGSQEKPGVSMGAQLAAAASNVVGNALQGASSVLTSTVDNAANSAAASSQSTIDNVSANVRSGVASAPGAIAQTLWDAPIYIWDSLKSIVTGQPLDPRSVAIGQGYSLADYNTGLGAGEILGSVVNYDLTNPTVPAGFPNYPVNPASLAG